MAESPRPLDDGLSDRMSRVRRRDTKPEMRLRQELHRRGLRYRVDAVPLRSLRSRADLVFRPAKVAVYVDGCFWHGCPLHGTLPRNNREWWRLKLDSNATRDRRVDEQLDASGWMSVRIWEHEDPRDAADRVARVVSARRRDQAAR